MRADETVKKSLRLLRTALSLNRRAAEHDDGGHVVLRRKSRRIPSNGAARALENKA
jgi:hypothetical protein